MPTSHDVFLAAIPTYQQLRDAYVDLQGHDVTHRVNQLGTNRQDEYGDLINVTSFADSTIRVVPDLSAYFKAVASFNSNATTNESALVPLTAVCKLAANINVGDRIRFGQQLAGLENKEFQVAKVETQVHYKPISKKVTLVPVRDA